MSELYIRAADDANRLHDAIGVLLKALLQVLRHSQHGRDAIAVSRVHTHRVHVFDEADGDHLVLRVAHDLEFELLPTEYRLFDEYLVHQTGGNPAGRDSAQFLDIPGHAAACATKRVGRANHNRVAQFLRDLLSLLDAEGRAAARHLYAQTIHRILERDAVLTALDSVRLDADYLHAVLVQYALLVKLCGKIQSGLTAQVRQYSIRALLRNNLLQALNSERLHVRRISHPRIGHDRCRIGVDQDDLVPG